MSFAFHFKTAFSLFSLLGILGGTGAFLPATAAPYDQLDQSCNPKFSGTHDCLDPVPTYSYHLLVSSDYSGELCVSLGDWEGENQVVVEWDGLQASLQLTGKAGVNHLLQPEQREGRSSAVVLYSDLPLMPQIVAQDCGGKGRNTDEAVVTAVAWPEADDLGQGNLAQVPGQANGQDTDL